MPDRTYKEVMADPWGKWDEHFKDMGSTCDAHDRIAQIKTSVSIEWLWRVLNVPGTQKTVIKAAERRLRKLKRLNR